MIPICPPKPVGGFADKPNKTILFFNKLLIIILII